MSDVQGYISACHEQINELREINADLLAACLAVLNDSTAPIVSEQTKHKLKAAIAKATG